MSGLASAYSFTNGAALAKFKEFITAQGGDASVVDDYTLLPQASFTKDVVADQSGYVTEIVADDIGVAAMTLGAGRATKESQIDLAAGLYLHKKVGDKVEEGDVLATLYTNHDSFEGAEEKVKAAYSIGTEQKHITLIHEIIHE